MLFDLLFDFHTHSFLSDGVLSPVELARRAHVRGYSAIAITDHVGLGNLEPVLSQVVLDCRLICRHWPILAIPGVELTHVPAASIAELAARAKQAGARIVVVHGETVVEPVEPGTNRAAIRCPDVDILAHPGLIAPEDVALAAETGTYLELTPKRGHSLGNGRLVVQARAHGARLLVNSDTHLPEDLLTPDFARTVALGAGLRDDELAGVLIEQPRSLLARLGLAMRA
ncbi:MAG: histidinol phosphate phosphatase domain-containing protein [Chloroflexi bacterium]|nr:histidinol phosphate phosphatase domain-containing protein [Chloroflexota bacterium]